MRDAVLRLDGPAGEIVLSREQDRVPLAINSFPTAAGRHDGSPWWMSARAPTRPTTPGRTSAARWCWPMDR